MESDRSTVGLESIIICSGRSWQLFAAAPSTTDWIVSALCLGCAAAAIRMQRGRGRAAGRWFWRMLSVLLLLLGFARLLDLDNALFAAGRCAARVGGWYGDRQDVQALLSVWAVMGSGVLVFLAVIALRGRVLRNLPALAGLLILLAVIGLRLISAHGFDRWLYGAVAGVPRHFILDLLAIGAIGFSIALHMAAPLPSRRRRRRRRHGVRGRHVRLKRHSSRGRPSDGPRPPPPPPLPAT